MTTSVVTARLDSETLAELDKIAAFHDRSRAWLVAKAIKRFVKEEGEFFAFIQQGDDAIDRGDYLTQEEMEDWIANRHKTADAA